MEIQNKIFDKIIIANLILLSGSILSVGYFTSLFSYSIIILFIALIINRVIPSKEFKIFALFLSSSVIILSLNLLFSISNTIPEYLTFSLRLFIGGLSYLALSKRSNLIPLHLFNILKIIGLISLIGFFISQFYVGKEINLNDGFRTYTIFYFHFYGSSVNFFGIPINRNSGIFWEPGVLTVFANIYLYLSLFILKKSRDALIASIVILTTLSTTGLFLLGFQWLIYLGKNRVLKLRKIVPIIIAISMISYFAFTSLMQKQNESKNEAISSYSLRVYDIYSAGKIIYNHPFVGIGLNKKALLTESFKNLTNEFAGFEYLMQDRGNSNSILSLFIVFGIPIGLMVLKLLYKQNIFLGNKKVLLFIIIVLLSSEPLLFSPFFIFLFYSGWREILIQRKTSKMVASVE